MAEAQYCDYTSLIAQAALRATRALGYEGMKALQEEAIIQFVGGKDVFICLPTGYGKSLCYQVLPLIYAELCGRHNMQCFMPDQELHTQSRGQYKQ